MRTLLLLLLGLFITNSFYAQQKSFVEIPIYSTLDWNLLPLDSTQFNFTTYDIRNTVDEERIVDLVRYSYNDQFELLGKTSIRIPNGYNLRPLKVWNQQGIYYLYISTLGEELMVVHLKPDGTNIRQKIPLLDVKYVPFFDASEDQVLISVRIDSKPTVFLFDLDEGRLKTIEGFYEKKLKLLECQIDPQNRLISIIKEEVKNKERVLLLKNYDYEGHLLREVELEVPDSQRLNSASVTNIKGGNQFIVGDYVNAGKKGTTGSYIAKVDQGGGQRFNFIPYFEMEGYERSLNKVRSERKKERAKRKYEKKGEWSTAIKLRLSEPFLVNDRIHLFADQMVANTYRQHQMIFNESTELLDMLLMPVYEWGSLDWAANDELISLNREGLIYYISKVNGTEVSDHTLEIDPDFLPEGISNLRVAMTTHWYKNTILIGFTYDKNGRKYYTITGQNIN